MQTVVHMGGVRRTRSGHTVTDRIHEISGLRDVVLLACRKHGRVADNFVFFRLRRETSLGVIAHHRHTQRYGSFGSSC